MSSPPPPSSPPYPLPTLSPSPSSPDDLDSLPDSASSDDIDDSDDRELEVEESDAEKEWQESVQQLELLLTIFLVPYVGKYFGRKCAYWGESILYYGYGDRGVD